MVKPFMVDQRIAKVFGISDNVPLLIVKGKVSNEDNQQVELAQVIYSPHIDFKLATRVNS